jgi:hypothetical protein
MESMISPRGPMPLDATKRIVGFVVLIMAATLVWPLPFSHIIPTLVIVLMSFAYLERDAVLLSVALIAAAVSLAISAGLVWATIGAAEAVGDLIN